MVLFMTGASWGLLALIAVVVAATAAIRYRFDQYCTAIFMLAGAVLLITVGLIMGLALAVSDVAGGEDDGGGRWGHNQPWLRS